MLTAHTYFVQTVSLPVCLQHPNLEGRFRSSPKTCMISAKGSKTFWVGGYLRGMGMELRHLRYFVASVREGSVTRAAKTLNMAQPPLSRQLQQLEEELGVALIERGSRPLRVTDAGRFFLRARPLHPGSRGGVEDDDATGGPNRQGPVRHRLRRLDPVRAFARDDPPLPCDLP